MQLIKESDSGLKVEEIY